jgi:uncharacterized protein (TIGR02246 family)
MGQGDDGGLEARLRRLEDQLEIQQLFVDYGRHLDQGNFAAFAELFCQDAEFSLERIGTMKGPREIQATMEASLGVRLGQTMHIISSPAIVLDGDRATSEVMWTVLVRTPEGAMASTAAGRHVDELVRENGRWRFSRRRGLVDLPTPGSL